MIHMIPGRPVSLVLQCKLNRHEHACLESFHAMERFEPAVIEAHQAPEMICKARSLKSRIKTHLFLEEIITNSDEVFKILYPTSE